MNGGGNPGVQPAGPTENGNLTPLNYGGAGGMSPHPMAAAGQFMPTMPGMFAGAPPAMGGGLTDFMGGVNGGAMPSQQP